MLCIFVVQRVSKMLMTYDHFRLTIYAFHEESDNRDQRRQHHARMFVKYDGCTSHGARRHRPKRFPAAIAPWRQKF